MSQVPGKQFVDLQNDVTAQDVELAGRESYRSVEHLKRYTTTAWNDRARRATSTRSFSWPVHRPGAR